MTATVNDRNTAMKDGEVRVVPVAANTKIPGGTIVCVNAAGYAVPGIADTTLAYLGRAEELADNTGGALGAMNVQVRCSKTFKWANSVADAVTQASLGRACYVEDNQTVAKTNGTNTRTLAGIVVQIDADGIWVK